MIVRIAIFGLAAVFLASCSGAVTPTLHTETPPPPATATVGPAATQTSGATQTAAATETTAATLKPSPDPDVIAAIQVGSGPCAMVELNGSVWVTNYGDGTVVRIDGTTNSVAQTVSLGAGSTPCGITAANGNLWVGALGKNALDEVDPESGTIVKSIDVGGPTWDVQAGFGSVWASIQGPDKIIRIDPTDGSVAATIDGGPTVSGLAVTADEVWVANQGRTMVDRIDPTKNKFEGHIELSDSAFWFAVGDTTVLASLTNADSVVVIDAVTGKAGEPIAVGQRPRDPGFVNGSFWMPNQITGDVTVIDPNTGAIDGSFTPPGAAGIFVADQAIGDGWILDYAGTTAFRMESESGIR